MDGRVYSAPINVAAHTAQVDIFELLAASGKPLELLSFELGQTSEIGDAQEEFVALVLKRVTGAPTSGSGGSTPTLQPRLPNDTAAGATLETGNTTKLTGGTSTELARFVWSLRGGLLYIPIPEERFVIDAGTRLVLEEAQTVIDSVTGPVGRIVVRELV